MTETWVNADTGEEVPVEEMKPKKRVPKGPPAEEVRKELEAAGEYVDPIRYAPVEEPPPLTDTEAVAMEAALEIFADDMSPAEKARLEAEIEALKDNKEVDAFIDAIESLDREPRGRVLVPEKGLVEKLVEIMAAVDAVEKHGRNDAQKYNYQRATDVFNAVRPEFIKRGLLFTMSVIGARTTVIPKPQGGQNILVDIECEFTVRDGREVLTFTGAASGIDSGDKGTFKAITGAMKYGIRQLLMLPDENDPERARPDENTDGPINITGAPSMAPVQQGGRQTMATQPQINAIKKIAGDNSLSAETLAAYITTTLGEGPSIDGLSENEAAKVVLDHLSGLSFADCGKIVKGLHDAYNGGS